METHTATSGTGTWTLAKYWAVPTGFRSCRTPSQMNKLDIKTRASGSK